jgi:hypothetical protein
MNLHHKLKKKLKDKLAHYQEYNKKLQIEMGLDKMLKK